MCDEPKITVGITTYNRPSFLRAAVASVISQSYQNFEIIISNDYLDKPVSIESLLDRKDPRVTVINQARNLGELDNMNFLLSIATGKYFTWLADDDLMLPNFFAKAMKSLQTNQNINCVGFYSSFSAAVNYMSHPLFNRAPPEITLLDQSLFIELYTARKISLIGCYGIFNTEKLREIEGITRLGRS